MTEFLIVFVLFAVAIVLMALSLTFSKYKKRKSACCGGGHCESEKMPQEHKCKKHEQDISENK